MASATDYYSASAAEFHLSYETDPNRLERVAVWRDALDLHARGRDTAYDLGCGSGVITRELALRVRHVTAIDGAAGMLEIARAALRRDGVNNVEFRHGHLPLRNASGLAPADIVISSSALEYMDSLACALKFAGNLLAPNGILIFSMSNRQSLSRNLVRLVHRMTGHPAYLSYLRHFVTVGQLRSELATAGLRHVDDRYFGSADWLNRILAILLPRAVASNMILMIARPDDGGRLRRQG